MGDTYRYETALDASEAMQIIEELVTEGVKILIVISDWLMPNIKGDEFLRNVHQRYPEIQKIIITGHADIASVEALKKEINLYSYLKKPWDEKELVTTITSALK
ncbi:response regulator receiver domain protein [Leptospira broomii serovar Hurstbridge str. 5399]|uniref:Response regulator receiver domain protein n=1 Tax=Leptospira broomii serovar Hurstbridge str. 5399 TaxID=1049789 RepID=T0F9N7_9LEPT|nr:response regulator receiver domain protein [Leptospira broomii serovar Hurstbridge str. 5399]